MTSSVTWPFDSRWSTSYGWSIATMRLWHRYRDMASQSTCTQNDGQNDQSLDLLQCALSLLGGNNNVFVPKLISSVVFVFYRNNKTYGDNFSWKWDSFIVKQWHIFLLLARYVPNVAKRSIWNQCNIEDRPTDRPTTNDRPLFVEEPCWMNFKRPYLHSARQTHGHYGPPIESRPPGVEWSRDQWRHMTPKGQGRDPITFEAPNLRNGAR